MSSKVEEKVSVSLVQNDEQPSEPARAVGVFHVECRDAGGNLEWSTEVKNALANEGANYLRDCYFRANTPSIIANAPYIGLATAAPSASTTLSTVTEATGGGYVRKLPTWATSNPGSANNTSSAASWTASGTAMSGVSHLFVTDASSGTSGKFMSYATLSGGPYTVNVGSTLNVTYTWTVS